MKFMERMREDRKSDPEQESPQLLAERAALFAVECRRKRRGSGVETVFADADLRRVQPWLPEGYQALARLLIGLLDNPGILAVGGDRGRGKTWLACGLVNAFCDENRSAVYRRTKEYFDGLSNAGWEAKDNVRERFLSPTLLVLDEVQVRDENRDWQDNELTQLIDRRYARHRTTLLISNLTAAALKQNLGESIWRRMLETGGDPIECDWLRIEELRESHRQNLKAKFAGSKIT